MYFRPPFKAESPYAHVRRVEVVEIPSDPINALKI